MGDLKNVVVKDSDMISAKSLLELLQASVKDMKERIKDPSLTETTIVAIAGASEALTDLHNLVLEQLQNARLNESFDNSSDDKNGNYDA